MFSWIDVIKRDESLSNLLGVLLGFLQFVNVTITNTAMGTCKRRKTVYASVSKWRVYWEDVPFREFLLLFFASVESNSCQRKSLVFVGACERDNLAFCRICFALPLVCLDIHLFAGNPGFDFHG